MDKSILNELNIGEKAIDIQEYFWSKYERDVTCYQLTIYTCKSFLFSKYIHKKTFPFYFSTKNLAEEFAANHEKYKIKYCRHFLNEYIYPQFEVYINDYKQKGKYALRVDKTHGGVSVLQIGDIWGGDVDIENSNFKRIDKTCRYTEIDKYEEYLAPLNTYGKTFTYKLSKI